MGVTAQTFNFLQKYIGEYNSICELGDQQFMCCPPFEEQIHTRTYFESLNKYYISIDLNGKGGSLQYNLDSNIIGLGEFDIVTNFGTLEHIDNFYRGFYNVHNFCKTNGLMFHVEPKTGHWPKHGNFFVTTEFFENLAKLCSYEILITKEERTEIGGIDSNQIYCVLRKTSTSKFTLTEAEFYTGVYKE
jgi:hypothetical protein